MAGEAPTGARFRSMNQTFQSLLVAAVSLATWGSAARAEIKPGQFKHHFIAKELPGDNDYGFGSPALEDFDKDGDLDFAVLNRNDKIYWFENQGHDTWTRRVLGPVSGGQLGAAAIDVDGDGWTDLIIGGFWYRNSRDPRQREFTRYAYDNTIQAEIHDIVTADMNGDTELDVVVLGDGDGCFWYKIPATPGSDQQWPRTTVTLDVKNENDDIHGGIQSNGVGDLDGDGAADVVLTDRWYQNVGEGRDWKRHALPFGSRGPWGLSSRSWIADLDGDGDNDLFMVHGDQQNSGAAWLENNGQKPPRFEVRFLANKAPGTRGSFHSLALADFDQDGDLDALVVEQEDDSILPVGAGPRWFIFENLGGPGVRFEERVILDAGLGGHDVKVGDIDGDGDIDIASKIWNRWPGNANGGRFHADFLENTLR
jgi:hypothetical protein